MGPLIQPSSVPGTEVVAGRVLGEATPARTGRVMMAEEGSLMESLVSPGPSEVA